MVLIMAVFPPEGSLSEGRGLKRFAACFQISKIMPVIVKT